MVHCVVLILDCHLCNLFLLDSIHSHVSSHFQCEDANIAHSRGYMPPSCGRDIYSGCPADENSRVRPLVSSRPIKEVFSLHMNPVKSIGSAAGDHHVNILSLYSGRIKSHPDCFKGELLSCL